jgi:TPR repeat protein
MREKMHHLVEHNNDRLHYSKPSPYKGRLQKTIGVKRIYAATILLGMMASTAALGSHLDASSLSSGPPQIQIPPQVQKQASSPRITPASLPASRTKPKTPFQTAPHSIPTVDNQNKQAVKPHTKLGWGFLLKKQPQAAMTAYRQALRQNPKSARAYLGLGISLKFLGEVELAKKALVKAVALDPDLPPALVHLGYLYAEGHFGQSDIKTARRLFQQASQLGDPFASIALLDMKPRPKL